MIQETEKTEIQNKVLKALKIPARSYSDIRFGYYLMWCKIYSLKQGVPLHNLVTSPNMYEWYKTQWFYIVENQFYNDFKTYIDAGIRLNDRFIDLFDMYPEIIEGYFPGALLKVIRNPKSQTHGNEQNQDTRI